MVIGEPSVCSDTDDAVAAMLTSCRAATVVFKQTFDNCTGYQTPWTIRQMLHPASLTQS